MTLMTKDDIGRLVRDSWIAYCREIGDDKPSHLLPYDDLSEQDKEADRRIGEAVWTAAIQHTISELNKIKRYTDGLKQTSGD